MGIQRIGYVVFISVLFSSVLISCGDKTKVGSTSYDKTLVEETTNTGVNNQDTAFLKMTQDASSLWSIWSNLSNSEKIQVGRFDACQKIQASNGNLRVAAQNLIFAHGGNPQNLYDMGGASIVVGRAVEYYCQDMRQPLAEWMRRESQPPPFPDPPPLPPLL